MKIATVESWLEAPLARYVDEARARLALLLLPSGQVIAQAGFLRAMDAITACALSAAAHATACELGKCVDGKPFKDLHYAGPDRQLYLASLETPRGMYVALTVFDDQSSLGLVRMYFADLARELATTPRPAEPRAAILAMDFEAELNRNLAMLFGRGEELIIRNT